MAAAEGQEGLGYMVAGNVGRPWRFHRGAIDRWPATDRCQLVRAR
jgi:hypothetical protein